MISRACGLEFLRNKYQLRVPPPLTRSFIRAGKLETIRAEGEVTQFFPESYEPAASDGAHLEFALKREAIDLRLLAAYFQLPVAKEELTALLREKPTGQKARRLWFLYEWLTDNRLELPDVKLNYVPLLDSQEHVVSDKPTRSRRHCVINNLPGTPWLCPLVRRTQEVNALLAYDFQVAIERAVPPCVREVVAWNLGSRGTTAGGDEQELR